MSRTDIYTNKDEVHGSDEESQALIVKDDSQQQLKANMEIYQEQDHASPTTIHSSVPKNQCDVDELPSSSDSSDGDSNDDEDSNGSLSDFGGVDDIG